MLPCLNENDLDRVKLLKSMCYRRRKLERMGRRSLVAFWKGVWKWSQILKCGNKFKVGEGKNVGF